MITNWFEAKEAVRQYLWGVDGLSAGDCDRMAERIISLLGYTKERTDEQG